ncbi:imidazolonepropionase [Myxococcota bacterium]|nr:imidazolonepropionase [Myxococcota bacterium]
MTPTAVELLITGMDELHTMDPTRGEGPTGLLRGAAIGFTGGRVSYLGPAATAPEAQRRVDAPGTIGLPGLIDCHTHSLYAGDRAGEFRRRLNGEPYTAILESGGGILSTVRATREASDEALAETLHARLQGMLRRGVTTVEVKTGYALDEVHELRCLRLLKEGRWPQRVVPTYLGAHAVPAEFRQDREAYLRLMIDRVLPQAAELAEAVDVYCDRGAFTLDEARRVLEAGMSRGLVGRVHAEQVEFTGAASLAASLGCASADHLERIDEAGVTAMAMAGTIGGMLPTAMLYMRDVSPPARRMVDAGVRLAVGTDYNPGSSPCPDLWTAATLACLLMGLTVEEALLGVTRHAGLALGRPELGWLTPGGPGDLCLMTPPPGAPARAETLVQHMGGHRAAIVVREGRVVLEVVRGG